jgi:hypothetical protein
MRWAGHGACMGEKGFTYTVLVGKNRNKGTIWKNRHRYVDDIKIGLKKLN